jgi:uncharacterized protein
VRSPASWREVRSGGDAVRDFAARALPKIRRALRIPWVRMSVIGAATLLLCVYVGIAAVLYAAQRSMMYFPEAAHTTPLVAGLPEMGEVPLTAADGVHVTAWHVPPRESTRPVIIYLHGNGGALRYRAQRFRELIDKGIGLVALEYRGFGGNEGSPTEAGLIADGEAAYAFAAARYPATQIVIWGESLGTGIAVPLAAEKPVARVILEAPFTSAAAVAARRYWYLPVRLLMKDQYRSDRLVGSITVPVLILHGVHDRVIPYAMGEEMFALLTAPKHIVRFVDGDHEDLDRHGALHAVGRFLTGALDAPPHPPASRGVP